MFTLRMTDSVIVEWWLRGRESHELREIGARAMKRNADQWTELEAAEKLRSDAMLVVEVK